MFYITYHIIVLWLFNFLLHTKRVFANDDGGIVEGCCENEIVFGCKEEGMIVVVREAWLHDGLLRVPKYKCRIPEYNVQFKKGSVLQHIHKKCAMQRVCRFNALTDVPGAKEEEERWRGHVVRVNYECIKEDVFFRACGEKIEAQQGWLQNVGYPRYYLGPGACTFTLIVDSGQKVNLKILDLSTKEIVRPAQSECHDYISVTEGNQQLFETCGDPNKPISVMSRANILNVTLHTSVNVYPKRGFVANFKAVGCPTPRIPDDGYMAHRNASHAEFWCCVRHVFPDTMERVRTLTCEYQRNWDRDLPDCIDIILPGVIMTVLILGNVGILLLIIMCRRRIRTDSENPEELESIKANAEPTDITEPVPCQV